MQWGCWGCLASLKYWVLNSQALQVGGGGRWNGTGRGWGKVEWDMEWMGAGMTTEPRRE